METRLRIKGAGEPVLVTDISLEQDDEDINIMASRGNYDVLIGYLRPGPDGVHLFLVERSLEELSRVGIHAVPTGANYRIETN